jgi:hypothetical protein
MARTLRLVLTALYVVLLASCSEGGPSEAPGNPEESPPTPVEDASDEVIDACNAFVADSQPFYKVSQGLFAPESTVQMAVMALKESQSALAGDATAFKDIGEAKMADVIRRLADAIGALAAAIESSGSIKEGMRSELPNMQAAVEAAVRIGHACA